MEQNGWDSSMRADVGLGVGETFGFKVDCL